MANNKILVTGGAGFIGSHVVDALIDSGYKVVVVDNLSTGKRENLNKKAKFYHIDITDKKRLEEILEKERPEIVNHHAAQISVIKSVKNPDEDLEINGLGTLNLLRCSVKYNVKKVIYASTGGAIYGEVKEDDLPASESHKPKPVSPYGITKYLSELYLRFYSQVHGLPYISLRYANVYGPRQDAEGEAGVVAIFTKQLLKNDVPIIYGAGSQQRDFVYVADVVKANLLAINSKNAENQEINIATKKAVSVNELFYLLKKITCYEGNATYEAERHGEIKKIYLANAKAKKLLGWSPEVSLEDGLKKTAEWYKK